ncbi:histidinol dehydrogenase [Olivibacter sp. SDN3]|uniref:histidinol dehydrogenase n=1 Tax=Olivibacter sp. SDN3 TaxID=2764720 RepID=UPI0016515989|nr:histidinol dehydrogenase [Olivibacter sp. SDN3]QNL49942.1 histidinol dehydrogenase [Olivibacter sp. SDN3]
MLKTYVYNDLSQEKRAELTSRNTDPANAIQQSVEEILEKVRQEGDHALINYALKFDKVNLHKLYLEADEIKDLASTIDRTAQRALEIAFNNIFKFHQSQLSKEKKIETMPGVTCWREPRPIERVGLYVPGGTAVLPSTFLMLGIPARIAGCKEIIVCSPPQADGKINGYIAYCAQLLKIDRIFLVGGAQAIAAMAYGTHSISKVDKIFGPGNQFVTKAKTIVQANASVAIDMPAGPSEVLVIADESSNPAFVAADLLAQAEHGKDSQAILVTDSQQLIDQVNVSLREQISVLPRAPLAEVAINNSYAMLCDDLTKCIDYSNHYAPEHLIIAVDNWSSLISKIISAGSVFLGHLTPESAGDYASGTNHTLPTGSFARSYSGVSVDSFIKKITFQYITAEGINNIGSTVETLADLEGLQAHKNAVTIRNTQSNKH